MRNDSATTMEPRINTTHISAFDGGGRFFIRSRLEALRDVNKARPVRKALMVLCH
jgi:hypothetical protein